MKERSGDMAKAAMYAYLDGKEAKAKFKELGYTGHKFFDINGAQCHAVWNKTEYLMAFRGTEPTEFSDVAADLNAIPDRGINGGWVHNGFQNEVEKIWPDLKAHYEKTHQSKDLFICGHSLGGAMATVAAYRMDGIVDGLWTYGSPRVGTRGYIKKISCPHLRHVNNNDLVTTVPPALMMYKHHGELVYINFYGNVRKLTVWQRIKDKIRGYRSGLFDGFADHAIGKYAEYLSKKDNQ